MPGERDAGSSCWRQDSSSLAWCTSQYPVQRAIDDLGVGIKKLAGLVLIEVSLPVGFNKTLPQEAAAAFGLSPLPESPNGPLVSERALLEMLSEIGLQQSIEEARHIKEAARSLRPEALRRLLQECVRVKVLRLCSRWADGLQRPCSSDARKAVAESRAVGQGGWTIRMKDGTTLILKP